MTESGLVGELPGKRPRGPWAPGEPMRRHGPKPVLWLFVWKARVERRKEKPHVGAWLVSEKIHCIYIQSKRRNPSWNHVQMPRLR